MLDELLVGLGFDYDPEEMSQFKNDIRKTTGIIKSFAKVALAGAAAITAITTASTAASDEQGKLASELSENVGLIDALQFAMKRSGGSAEDMTGSLRNLTKLAGEAARGIGGGVEAFGLLGISVTDAEGKVKKSSDLFSEITKIFENLTTSQQIDLAGKLGLSGSIRLLQQGSEGLQELTDRARELGVTTDEDASISAEFQDSLTDIWQVTKDISRTMSRHLAPVMMKVKESLLGWWVLNKDLIEQNLPIWINRITTAMKLMAIATGVWLSLRLVSHIVTLISLFKGLSIAALAANASALLLPTLIAAGVAALALLVQDAKTFFEGGESFIGDMIEKFPQWEAQITTIAALFATISDLVVMIGDGWSLIIDSISNFSLDGIIDDFKLITGDLLGAIGINSDPASPFPTPEQRFGPKVDTYYDSDFSNQVNSTKKLTIDKVEINVDGTGRSSGEVASEIADLLRNADSELNTGVDQ
jgi:hypothetical protein